MVLISLQPKVSNTDRSIVFVTTVHRVFHLCLFGVPYGVYGELLTKISWSPVFAGISNVFNNLKT